MAVIKQSSVDEVKAAADMVEIVGARTQLRRSGAQWSGRCPFHEEKTPSFSVDPVGKLFYCFGCGKGGDLITFVQETEGLDFVQAIEWLADRYRVALEYEETTPQDEARRARRDRLLALLEQAAVFYERHLWETEAGEPVRAYLAGRGLGEEACREFRLGLSPGGAVLAEKARGKGYTQDELVAAGLVNRRGNDYFAGRLVFPLADARGRVLGFGARRLREDDPIPAKYVNSPEGEVFRKGSIVYGLDRARAAVAKEDRAVVVEGYTDVLALHQAGLHGVVASMGTALTEPQLKELRRLARHLFLCFDADAAGEAATLRGMELAVKAGFDVRVVPLPPGLDPADAADGFEERLAGSVGYLRHRVDTELASHPKQEAFEHVQRLVDAAPPGPERDEVARYASDRLGVQIRIAAGNAAVVGRVSPKLLEAGERLERRLLAACTTSPDLVERYLKPLDDRHFDSELHRRLRRHLADGGEAEGDLIAAVAELGATAAAEELDENVARELFLRLEERLVQRELAEEVKGGDTKRVLELQQVLHRIREARDEAETELR
ncbi:MAG TPA: DNA primase [Gaiellaceae bacterium]|nr:DNA primase [Gaiellaceae bacterium]